MVKNHSDSERGNLFPPHGLLIFGVWFCFCCCCCCCCLLFIGEVLFVFVFGCFVDCVCVFICILFLFFLFFWWRLCGFFWWGIFFLLLLLLLLYIQARYKFLIKLLFVINMKRYFISIKSHTGYYICRADPFRQRTVLFDTTYILPYSHTNERN